jgi:hypothetical protein
MDVKRIPTDQGSIIMYCNIVLLGHLYILKVIKLFRQSINIVKNIVSIAFTSFNIFEEKNETE